MNRAIPELTADDIARFWRKVAKRGPNVCWPWIGANWLGYGLFSIQNYPIKAHRLSYFLATGIDPLDQMVLHSCDYPKCVNPLHLSLGTAYDNTQDSLRRKRHSPGKGNPGGENGWTSKLKEVDIREIRALALFGLPQRLIAKQFKISQQTVSEIITNKIWRDLK